MPSYEIAIAETAVINLSSLGPGTVRQNPFRVMLDSSELRGKNEQRQLGINGKCMKIKRNSTLLIGQGSFPYQGHGGCL
jgi:hypothetical protein